MAVLRLPSKILTSPAAIRLINDSSSRRMALGPGGWFCSGSCDIDEFNDKSDNVYETLVHA